MIFITSTKEHSPVAEAYQIQINFAITEFGDRAKLYSVLRGIGMAEDWDISVLPSVQKR